MNAHNHDFSPALAVPAPGAVTIAADAAVRRVAPVWPLQSFVAVNPFLGLSDQTFAEAAETVAAVSGARITMPRAFYAEAIASGRITADDLRAAVARAGRDISVEALKMAARAADAVVLVRPTVADVAAVATRTDWPAVVLDRISAWAGAWFDEGQAAWRAVPQGSAWASWKAFAAHDRTAGALGLKGMRGLVRRLPEDAGAALEALAVRLRVADPNLEGYFHRCLATVPGWAAMARYRLWQAELAGGGDETLRDLLVIRLAWEVALLDGLDGAVQRDWLLLRDETGGGGPTAEDLILQDAYELGWRRGVVSRLGHAPATRARPAAQVAFCIDVRSEVFRRALEAVAPAVETLGFAGFFGVPLEVVPLEGGHGGARCPVLLAPKVAVAEPVAGDAGAVLAQRRVERRATSAWAGFKRAAVSSFAFVEAMGLTRGVALARGEAARRGCEGHDDHGPAPALQRGIAAGRAVGVDLPGRIAMAEGILKAMSLTGPFGRLVVLAGHGSSTTNNPHGAGLDCGACGGHSGEANARVAAALLNEPEVRAGLAERGLPVPDDTVFVAALHDTTTDRVTVYGRDGIGGEHRAELDRLEGWFAEAGRRARAERGRLLGLAPGASVDTDVVRRSRDWSEVRPEWGLAGCAAFIAAPRERTAGLDLGGRAFLHTYDWRQDDGFGVLTLILTAPAVVASWISLQYYGSTVDNAVWGSGNKVLHNVVGTVGVLEGSGGDLRTGLAWQSVHDGERFIHEPMRLSVMVEAPTAAIDGVLAVHEGVRELVANGWVHLFAIRDDGSVAEWRAGAWEDAA